MSVLCARMLVKSSEYMFSSGDHVPRADTRAAASSVQSAYYNGIGRAHYG